MWGYIRLRCAFTDLDEFYHHYITADRAIFLAKVTKGFVSGNLKTLFDRMIPLYLPYTEYSTGESMHVPRYEGYPDIEFYYERTHAFDDEIGEKLSRPYRLSAFQLRLLKVVDRLGLSNIGWHKVLKQNNAFEQRLDRPFL